MNRNAKIFVSGHTGMIGRALVKTLMADGYRNIVTKSHSELDLLRQADTEDFFNEERPEYVFLLAAKVGGILSNASSPAEYFYENATIQSNVIQGAHKAGVKKLIFTASVTVYPQNAPQPLKEEYLMNGMPGAAVEGYAMAKLFGIEMCKLYRKQFNSDFTSVILPHIFGPNDNFEPESATLMAAMIYRFWDAKRKGVQVVEPWGSGKPLRTFLYIDDAVEALVRLMNGEIKVSAPYMNLASDMEISISELAELIKVAIGYTGEIRFDTTRIDGVHRNILDGEILGRAGWRPKVPLLEGIRRTIEWLDMMEGTL